MGDLRVTVSATETQHFRLLVDFAVAVEAIADAEQTYSMMLGLTHLVERLRADLLAIGGAEHG